MVKMIKIIAEAGCNWKNIDEAFNFISKSRKLKLFATKFQIYNDDLIKNHPDRKFLKSIMIDHATAQVLWEYGQEIGQEVFFTPMFPEAVDWCEEIGVSMYKIRHKDFLNMEIIQKCINTKKPTFISYLMFQPENLPFNLYPIYCVPAYPADDLDYWDIDFTYFRGISDHTKGLRLISQWNALLKNVPCTDMYFEKHLKLDGTTPLENDWSVSFSELKEVLK